MLKGENLIGEIFEREVNMFKGGNFKGGILKE